MALNPPLSADGSPLRVANELFVLKRNNIDFEVNISGMGKYTGKGHVMFVVYFSW